MKFSFNVRPSEAGRRFDVVVAAQPEVGSRNVAQRLIDEGRAMLNGEEVKHSQRVEAGDEIEIEIPEPESAEPAPERIPLDILFEDDELIVVNKSAGMVVHPAPGHPSGTLVNALLAHCDDLAGIGGVSRPGIVHRLDKDTSGCIVVAKTDLAHRDLQQQIKQRTAGRMYWSIVHKHPGVDQATIEAPIGRDPGDRKKMAIVEDGRPALTHMWVLRRLAGYALVECRLRTGRTHQIRVHMAQIGHPVAGDPIYGGRSGELGLMGQALHARRLHFRHPRTGEALDLIAPLPADFQAALNFLSELQALDAVGGLTDPRPEE